MAAHRTASPNRSNVLFTRPVTALCDMLLFAVSRKEERGARAPSWTPSASQQAPDITHVSKSQPLSPIRTQLWPNCVWDVRVAICSPDIIVLASDRIPRLIPPRL
eukprot:m.77922 g.77922  ORF g.77922 m.77922 type:complete len:105 (-) comp50527_c0_seq7:45-359(-)